MAFLDHNLDLNMQFLNMHLAELHSLCNLEILDILVENLGMHPAELHSPCIH
jgi:hypothetical protein